MNWIRVAIDRLNLEIHDLVHLWRVPGFEGDSDGIPGGSSRSALRMEPLLPSGGCLQTVPVV